jgi:hypothetical protein
MLLFATPAPLSKLLDPRFLYALWELYSQVLGPLRASGSLSSTAFHGLGVSRCDGVILAYELMGVVGFV